MRLIVDMEVHGIDWDWLEGQFDKELKEGMKKLSEEIDTTWRKFAEERLNQSKAQYLEGLHVDLIGQDVQAELRGFVPVAVEEGLAGYDMKPGLLGTALAKVIPIGKRAGESPRPTRLTQNSKGWKHPGFQARKIHEDVQSKVDEEIMPKIFGDMISRMSV